MYLAELTISPYLKRYAALRTAAKLAFAVKWAIHVGDVFV